ncbi:unnamed protein product [Symbiodinium pilosum]|uniref:Uncharacterized protein n=1 Tax=Symbiodinium pilosum TaxID=2952 RepID=A0A812S826_SYMPI|nr:unnamed protein product [Symbiodinium pilosum]
MLPLNIDMSRTIFMTAHVEIGQINALCREVLNLFKAMHPETPCELSALMEGADCSTRKTTSLDVGQVLLLADLVEALGKPARACLHALAGFLEILEGVAYLSSDKLLVVVFVDIGLNVQSVGIELRWPSASTGPLPSLLCPSGTCSPKVELHSPSMHCEASEGFGETSTHVSNAEADQASQEDHQASREVSAMFDSNGQTSRNPEEMQNGATRQAPPATNHQPPE